MEIQRRQLTEGSGLVIRGVSPQVCRWQICRFRKAVG